MTAHNHKPVNFAHIFYCHVFNVLNNSNERASLAGYFVLEVAMAIGDGFSMATTKIWFTIEFPSLTKYAWSKPAWSMILKWNPINVAQHLWVCVFGIILVSSIALVIMDSIFDQNASFQHIQRPCQRVTVSNFKVNLFSFLFFFSFVMNGFVILALHQRSASCFIFFLFCLSYLKLFSDQ